MASIEDNLYMARLAEQAERIDDMIKFMDPVVKKGEELSIEERNLLSVAYKNSVGSRRTAWRAISAIEQNSKYEKFRDITKSYKEKIEGELNKICKEILNIIDHHLYEKASTPESQVFYLKMKADYFRYLSEVASGNSLKEASDMALDAYNKATEIATTKLAPTHPIRLGLALNFSVFHFEVLNNSQKACSLAKQAFDEAISDLEAIDDEQYKDSTTIMQLLRDNLTLWTADQNDDGDKDDDAQLQDL